MFSQLDSQFTLLHTLEFEGDEKSALRLDWVSNTELLPMECERKGTADGDE